MQIDLDHINPAEVPVILQALRRAIAMSQFSLVTEDIFLKPEMLAARWDISISCLNNWRLTGEGPNYVKVGPGPKAQVRYPLLGDKGVLDFEAARTYASTTQESASRGVINFPSKSSG